MKTRRWMVWILFLAVSPLYAQTLVDVEGKLAPAVSALCDDLAKRNPDGKEMTVATVPLVDAEQGIPKLGVVAAQIVERRILSSKPEWLRVQSRINLMSIMEEQKLWITDMVKASSRNNSAPAGFLEKADFLVVGVVTPGNDEVVFELRLIGTRNGNVVNAQTVSVPTSPAIRTLLRQMRRQEGRQATNEVAPVENIRVAMTAQRQGAPGMPVKEWVVTEGETLRGGSDQFNFRFSVDADACIYVFLFGSDQQAALLFPGDDWDVQFERQFRRKARKQDNYCRAEAEYTIPGPEASGQPRFFKLDTTPGSNMLYVCASRSETRNTRDIVDQLTRAGSEKDRMKLLTESIKFDCVTTFSFKQDDGKQAEVRPASPGGP